MALFTDKELAAHAELTDVVYVVFSEGWTPYVFSDHADALRAREIEREAGRHCDIIVGFSAMYQKN